MKTKYCFEIMELDDGLVAVPVGKNADEFHGVLKVNETAADILRLMEQDITEEKMVDSLLEKYMGDREKIAEYIRTYLEKLKAEGIVE